MRKFEVWYQETIGTVILQGSGKVYDYYTNCDDKIAIVTILLKQIANKIDSSNLLEGFSSSTLDEIFEFDFCFKEVEM
jgi:hypothetical protein